MKESEKKGNWNHAFSTLQLHEPNYQTKNKQFNQYEIAKNLLVMGELSVNYVLWKVVNIYSLRPIKDGTLGIPVEDRYN